MSQIFQKPIPKKILLDLLNNYSEKQKNYFIFSKTTFKKMKLKPESIEEFYKSIQPYYFKSKLFYLEREKTYKNMITIIRQICKFNHIPYTSKIIYSKSTYEIKYFIYHDLSQNI